MQRVSVLGEDSALIHVSNMARLLIESIAPINRCVGRRIHYLSSAFDAKHGREQRETYNAVKRRNRCIGVLDTVETQFVGHVGDLVLFVGFLGNGLQRAVFALVLVDCGPCETGFYEAAFEDLHDAMCVCVAAAR